MKTVIENIEKWAEDRNLIKGGTVPGQLVKIGEEMGETLAAAARGKIDELRDGIGDMFVVATILCQQMEFSIAPLVASTPVIQAGERATQSLCLDLMGQIGDLARVGHYPTPERMQVAVRPIIAILHRLASAHNLTLEDCAGAAYAEIKDRKGKMVDGIFIKEE